MQVSLRHNARALPERKANEKKAASTASSGNQAQGSKTPGNKAPGNKTLFSWEKAQASAPPLADQEFANQVVDQITMDTFHTLQGVTPVVFPGVTMNQAVVRAARKEGYLPKLAVWSKKDRPLSPREHHFAQWAQGYLSGLVEQTVRFSIPFFNSGKTSTDLILQNRRASFEA